MLTIINIITTGGTIEKTYNEFDGSLSNRGSQLRKMIERLRLPYVELRHRDLLCKDSLYMTDEDREKVLASVREILEQQTPILILHGTDTMDVTAKLLYDSLPALSVPIVLTGAMKPFGFEDSDALQNFTEALMACQIIGPGVYISMHGRLHQLPGVYKDKSKGTFYKEEN
jgi:L-asparaginase